MPTKFKNIFDGVGSRSKYARLIYSRLMTREWISYADILADEEKGKPDDFQYKRSYIRTYNELKKAFMDVRKAIGKEYIEEKGNNKCKSFRYIGKDDDPLRDMRNAKAIKDIRKYYEFCQDSAGFFPTAWLDYFLKDSRDLLEIKTRRRRGGQIISASLDRQLKNIDMLPQLYEAIHNKRVLSIKYKPYNETEMKLVFHPHFLKEYNGRWHLMGHAEGKTPENGFNLSIDRIVDTPEVMADKEYVPAPEHFYERFFENLVGVTHKDGHEAEDIYVRAYTNYIFHITDTKPIHPSQRVNIPWGQHEDGEYGEFVVHVEINNEFIGRILMMGDKLEVVAPENARNIFKERVADLAKRYADKG